MIFFVVDGVCMLIDLRPIWQRVRSDPQAGTSTRELADPVSEVHERYN